MRVPTAKERLFAIHYAHGCNAQEAAQRAGYSESHVKRAAYELPRRPMVAYEIDRHHRRIRQRTAYSVAKAMAETDAAMAVAWDAGDASTMVAIIELRAWLNGLVPPPSPLHRAAALRRIEPRR